MGVHHIRCSLADDTVLGRGQKIPQQANAWLLIRQRLHLLDSTFKP
jgi:hypothetical protein